jgi:hypothetical protein
MDETYRMLGREHEADLEREAIKWRRAAELRERHREMRTERDRLKTRIRRLLVRAGAFANRAARVEPSVHSAASLRPVPPRPGRPNARGAADHRRASTAAVAGTSEAAHSEGGTP